jgi:aldehyde:ferredoxin oxidoreductase
VARDEALVRVASWSGLGLALAVLEQRARRDPAAAVPLVLAVGECVRRGVPTAARASVVSRAPLTGRLADGQVGGDLGRRLATLADALELSGATRVPGAVLVLDADGGALLVSRPELVGATPRTTHARLREAHGECAVLCVGPGGERALPFASLVASGTVEHFVGRGGLGAVLGRLGLKALVVAAPPVPAASDHELVTALTSSPRLEGRAAGGTLELFDSFAARGALDPRARAVSGELAGAREARHGCAGCPTPCGWVLRGPQGRGQGARFGATWSLGLRLGLPHAEDALALLARCDDAGLDAKEVGAGLGLLRAARERGRLPGGAVPDARAACERWIDELLGDVGEGARMGRGARALAVELGLEELLDEHASGPARAQDDLAVALGATVGVRGPDPMRTFPFLLHDLGDGGELARLVAPLSLPAGASDPRDPAGKGRLVWWHENLSAALDATGFCSFSAAALLADGVLDLERLARWIEPSALAAEGQGDSAARLLAMGEALLHLARRLDERWRGGRPALPPGAAARVAAPGLLDEYAALRGLDAAGRLTAAARERFDACRPVADPAALPAPRSAPAHPARRAPAPRGAGRVRLRASGSLAQALGGELELELALPAPLVEVLASAAAARPAARDALLRDDRPRVAVYRGGARLAAGDEVRSGDRLEVVLVISGGAR